MIRTYFVVGPTASGKTEYAIRLAEDIGGEIVSADSMQIYKYMDIGSAKPSADELAKVKHHLIGEIDPKQPFNVSDYQKLALEYIRRIASEGKVPVVCGGTGLYINSLVYKMDFSAPEGDDAFRQRIFREEDGDTERLHERLRRLDPDAAEAIHPNNVKRVLRAIERLEKGEGKLAEFAAATEPSDVIEPLMLGMDVERSVLYDRINRRVDLMLQNGLAEEVNSLMDMGFTSSDVAMKGIGYKEIIDAVNRGEAPESAAETIKLNTRHYARRQMIWLRRYPQIKWVSPEYDSEKIAF
ncbi:MAG: tRNA (adenosine(37)-N6)-dimethylallyltransferase MiaA [Firmicutes bacterium]|nr:tRNA (adenosine(37)-N6)-dimethylallyltransferase MiaA [Bacillota bacterium]